MAKAPTVVTNATDNTPRVGNVLDGLRFFVVQRVPRRTGLLKDIEANGGHIVRHEAQSDYVIADHLRPEVPAGSYSYTFIDSAIKNGRLPDPADHATAGRLRSDRPVGSTLPGKHTRTPFTPQDDKDLWEFVEEAKQHGASVKGNDVYKQLEKVNPRHTFQAWRDRYIKKLLDKPPPRGAGAPTATTVLPTSPADAPDTTTEASPARPATATLKRKRNVQAVEHAPGVDYERTSSPERSTAQPKPAHTEMSDADLAALFDAADDIEAIPPDDWRPAWSVFEQAHPHRTAEEWSSLYLTHVRPLHRKRTREAAVAKYDGADDQDDIKTDGMAQSDARAGNGPSCARGNDTVRSTSSTPNVKKRKRTNPPSPPIARAASPKRRKAGSTHGRTLVDQEVMLTSDPNRDAEQQVQIEAGLSSGIELLEGDDIENSGGTVGLEDQTAINKSPNSRVDTDHQHRRLEEANQGADGQLHQIILDDDSEVESQLDVDDRGPAMEGDRAEAQSVFPTSRHLPAQHALTEANLASQQAQHKSYIPRATDLPPDEEEKDQSDFIDYLQTTLSKTKASHGDAGATGAGAQSKGKLVDLVPPNFWQTRPSIKVNGGMDAPAAHASQRKPPENIYIAQLHRRQRGEASMSNPRTVTGKSSTLNTLLQEEDEDDQDEGEGSDDAADGQDDAENQETYSADGDVDLTVVEPDGGFFATESPAKEHTVDSRSTANGTRGPSNDPIIISSATPSSSPFPASEDGKASVERKQGPAGVISRALDTQDILNAETQLPDFSMPEPSLPDDDSDGDGAHGMQPQAPADRSTQVAMRGQRKRADESDSDESTPDMDVWVLSMKARGFSDKAISKALRRTSYRPHLAQLVLFEEKRGNGLPGDTPGVWSKLEDEMLEGGDARKLRRLDEKHGSAECDARLDFLSQWRELFPGVS